MIDTSLTRIVDLTTGDVTITDWPEGHITAAARDYVEATGGDVSELVAECMEDPQFMHDVLGLTLDTAATLDLDSLNDAEWTDWVAAHLQRGIWTDERTLAGFDRATTSWLPAAQVVVRPGGGFDPTITNRWPGGAIQIKAVHGSTMNSWRRVHSWSELRERVDEVHEEEAEALAQRVAARAAEEASWQPLRDAQEAVEQAERHLRDARLARDREVRACLKYGFTAYRIAQVTGLSQPTIARIRR